MFNQSSLSYILLALVSAVTSLPNMALSFHDFPRLENEILKFHDFPEKTGIESVLVGRVLDHSGLLTKFLLNLLTFTQLWPELRN